MNIRLGFEVGSGTSVEIPISHTVICGVTQQSGKTTALEALITRSGLRAVTFLTKRGESSFTDARRIDPYFREQTDWQFVASILEASRGEKLKFERAWIIRASKGARTLEDVQRNVRHAMEKAKGLSADVYLTLDAYLEAVVPAIARTRWAPALDLRPGVNAIDLTTVPMELQHLVIKSSLDWVLERERDTVVVIPEAWKYIPQGRGTPVKLAAEAYIRQGAALRNLLWLDSQDLGGIEKTILRSVPVWILGVQREANEVKRTLENIPASVAKPSKAAIATLELGQFFACWGKHAIKVYVQPAWMDDDLAAKVATGRVTVDQAQRHHRAIEREAAAFQRRFMGRTQKTKGGEVDEREAQALRDENRQLKIDNKVLEAEVGELRRRLEALETQGRVRPADRARDLPRRDDNQPRDRVREAPEAPARAGGHGAEARSPRTFTAQESLDNEALYQAIKARLIEEAHSDPTVLALVLNRPELHVRIQRQTIDVDGDTLRGRIAQLMSEGFFDQPIGPGTVITELMRRGAGADVKFNVSKELQTLSSMGFLFREGKTSDTKYQLVPEMKVRIIEGVPA